MQADSRIRTFASPGWHGTCTGATLIEVLIAMLVFGIGIAGVLAMQLHAVKEDFDSVQRSLGIWVGQEVIDRLRLNPEAVRDNTYVDLFTDFDFADLCANPPARICADRYDPVLGASVDAETCNSNQMATFDAWELACTSGLVNPGFTLTCDDADPDDGLACSPGSNLTLELTWQARAVSDDRDIDDGDGELATQRFRQVFRP